MAKSFSKLTFGPLGILDTLTFGKYKDCRVCDVLVDDLPYFEWLKSTGRVFSKELEANIKELKEAAAWETYQREEVDPWIKPMSPFFTEITDEDVPF